MYKLSDACIAALDKRVRDETYVQITFGLTDVDAPSKATITDTGHLVFSNGGRIDDDDSPIVTKTNQTLELNRFLLDGYNQIYDAKTSLYQGYVGDIMSDRNGVFSGSKPKVTITFSGIVELVALTLYFDEYLNNYASELSIKAYNNNVEVLNKVYTPTSTMFVTPDNIPKCDKIEIVCNKTNVPYRRFRITKLLYGAVYLLQDDVIIDTSLKSTASVMSEDIPTSTFKFKFLDFDKIYAPNHPQSRLKYIEDGQFIRFEFNHTLDNGDLETIPMSYLYTSGEAKTEDVNIGEQVEITAVDGLSLMNGTFYQKSYNPNGTSYFDLLVEVFEQAEYRGKYVIDEYLKTLKTKVVMKGLSFKSAVQTIANAGCCDIYFDRFGTVHIKKHVETPTDFSFDFAKVTGDSKLSRTPLLKNVVSKYSTVSVGEEIVELGKSELDTSVTNYKVEMEFDPATEITYQANGLTIVGSPEIYATKFVAFVSGQGTLVVSGKKLSVTETVISKKFNDLGQDLQISNSLIDTQQDCVRYIDAFGEYYTKRSTYQFDNRGYPQIDVLDVPTYETTFSPDMRAIVIENEIKFNGAISGTTKVVSFE